MLMVQHGFRYLVLPCWLCQTTSTPEKTGTVYVHFACLAHSGEVVHNLVAWEICCINCEVKTKRFQWGPLILTTFLRVRSCNFWGFRVATRNLRLELAPLEVDSSHDLKGFHTSEMAIWRCIWQSFCSVTCIYTYLVYLLVVSTVKRHPLTFTGYIMIGLKHMFGVSYYCGPNY